MPILFKNCNHLTYEKLIRFILSNNGKCCCNNYHNNNYHNNKKYNYIKNRQTPEYLYRKRICQTCYFLYNIDHYSIFYSFNRHFTAYYSLNKVLLSLIKFKCIKIMKVLVLKFNKKLCLDPFVKHTLYNNIYFTLIENEEYDIILKLISSGLLDLSYKMLSRYFRCITIFDKCILKCCEKIYRNNHTYEYHDYYYKKRKCIIFINILLKNLEFLENFKFTNIFKHIKNRVKYYPHYQQIFYILLTNYEILFQKAINTNLSDIYTIIKYFKDINFVDCYKKCINIIFDKDLIYRYKIYVNFIKNDHITNYSNNKSLTNTDQIIKYCGENFYDNNILSYTFMQDLCHNKFYGYIGFILSIFYYIPKLHLPSEILYIIFNKLIKISIIDHT